MYVGVSLQTLWLERTTIYTKFTFPGILCWFEATSIETVRITSLQHFECLQFQLYSCNSSNSVFSYDNTVFFDCIINFARTQSSLAKVGLRSAYISSNL